MAKTGTKKKVKRKIDPQKLEQLRQKRSSRAILARMGFSRINSDGQEFEFDGRTGEIDDIFLQENVLIVTEYTIGKPDSGHVAKKSILYQKMLSKAAEWIETYSALNAEFSDAVRKAGYEPHEFQIFICYISANGISKEIEEAFKHYRFLDGTRRRYFDALSKTISRSARHEFYSYLGVDIQRLGERVHQSASNSKKFDGHLLPEANSGYAAGFKVVSFYADPATLLEVAYVLRRDSWRDPDGLYQRVLVKGKIAKMRKYLTSLKRVFVNNIIVTLPPHTIINDPTTGLNENPEKLVSVKPVSISVPIQPNMIGLVDGQHRVFCYHEAPNDPLDAEIAKQRKRQNLLVTGLIFPKTWNAIQKSEFEARLFLEINDTQARAKSALKQSIEIVLNPTSTIAIAKEITNRLSRSGPLATHLQTNFFDPPDRIKTTSIVSYGLRPLVKTDGTDSFFAAWPEPNKSVLAAKKSTGDTKLLLESYISFCVKEINDFLVEAKLAVGPDKWLVSTAKSRQMLGPTTINGFFVCMRRLIEEKKPRGRAAYSKRLSPIAKINFLTYKSSAWKALGDKIYEDCFK